MIDSSASELICARPPPLIDDIIKVCGSAFEKENLDWTATNYSWLQCLLFVFNNEHQQSV